MITATNLQSKHYLVVPGSNFRSPKDLNFMLSLSGISAVENFIGTVSGSMRKDVININADDMGMQKVIARVKSLLPALPVSDYPILLYGFVPLQWTVFTSIVSSFNKNISVNAGFELDDWKIIVHEKKEHTAILNKVNIFKGISVDLSVGDSDGVVSKIAYDINLHGHFVIYEQKV